MDHKVFQPADGTWGQYAAKGGLQSVLDPKDGSGLKNAYIDAVHKAALLCVAAPHSALSVLDYGCGTGRMGRFLAPRVGRVIGVDITREMLEEAERQSNPSNVEFRHMAGETLPLESRSVDLVVTVYVLQYVVREPAAYAAILSEFARVLRPAGRVVFIEQVSPSGSMERSYSMKGAVAPRDYIGAMAAAGLQVGDTKIVRLGSAGRLERMLMLNPRVPQRLRLAAAPLVVAKNMALSYSAVGAQSYVDYLISGRVKA
jgi:SAM-dependent methyltransferase